MKIYANLHLHTTHSDGVYSPEELVKVAKNEGYKALAISDHDTGTAFPEFREACIKEGMDYLFAVEFSVKRPKPCHLVAFDFDPEYPSMKKYLSDMGKRQTDNTKKCFDEAVEKGNIKGITWDEVLEYNKDISWLCNNHVFRAMKAKDLMKENEYMEWFGLNFRNQRAKFPPLIDFKTLPEVIKLIKEAGGLIILAHPCDLLDDIDYFLGQGIDGIEVWHPSLIPDKAEKAYKIAIEKNLYISGGSDHSGLCGGCYSSYPSEEKLKQSYHYIKPLSAGTTEKYFKEIKERKIGSRRV